ncbi:9-O-acetylesterase [Bacteroidia bacterium]|nr:9-O-acetylesterase [Bacteroidia bacterium]
MSGIFGDNMVLQQHTTARLWGWADPGKTVTVVPSWSGREVAAKADGTGKWSLTVDTPAGEIGKAHTIEISDGEKLILSNVYIGEIWICSGQSNMQIALRTIRTSDSEYTLHPILTSGNYRDRIRFATIPLNASETPVDNIETKWVECTPLTAPNFSCTAFFFARYLSDALRVPVGIVSCAWGGARIESFMDEASLKKIPGVDIAQMAADAKNKPNRMPCNIYNGMISAIKGYTARGFLWYQGESNRHSHTTYAEMTQRMVELWRSDWGDSEAKMPFYYVQIAPYDYPGEGEKSASIPLLVEAQVKALSLIPNSGLAGTTDLGDRLQIHPMKKEPVGFRLFTLAMAGTYGVKYITPTGPVCKSFTLEGDKATIMFENAPAGFMPDAQSIRGFEVAGDDKVFHPADKIRFSKDRKSITVGCSKVAKVASVRYAYNNVPDANLSNTYGLPAFPFRTDTWELQGKIIE